MKQKRIQLIILFCAFSRLYAPPPEEPEKPEPLKIGNLALPPSQCPGPLFAFGELLIEKGDVIGYGEYDGLRGCRKKADILLPFGVYGIRDNFSVSIFLPYALRLQEDCLKSSGMQDILVELEYAFWDNPTLYAYNWASIVGGIIFPAGSSFVDVPTGNGSHSYFIGLTLVHLGVDWYYFTSQGGIVTTKKNGNKVGDTYLYQFGVGRNIKSPSGWIFMGLVELLGTYSANGIVDCVPTCNQQSNVIFLAPSFFASNERFSMHAGIGPCIYQHLTRGSNKFRYIYSIEFSWKFDGPALRGKREQDLVK